ncbi:MAG: hypothetical protein RLZZ127_2897 [Planctomycetota bacterium]|jgi:hypothetical protein
MPRALLLAALALPAAAADGSRRIDVAKEVLDGAALADLREVVFAGRAKRYDPDQRTRGGLHIAGGATVAWNGTLRQDNTVASVVVGVHGPGTVLRFDGTWLSDEGGAIPCVQLTDGGRLILGAGARLDFVLAGVFYTRQLWVGGDRSGVIELEPGFVADRTRGGTVPDACGTIRLNGPTLVTRRSANLPFNTRPDGRGGTYPNGHVCFDAPKGGTWRVEGEPQIYPASIDFEADGTIDTRTDLIHIGRRRTALDVAGSGHFVSPGVFQSTTAGVTVTKTGPAMLALDGESGWMPGSVLRVQEGLLRIQHDPGEARFDPRHGPHLRLEVAARAHLSAPRLRLRALVVEAGGTVWLDRASRLETGEGATIAAGATLVAAGAIAGPLRCDGRLTPSPWGDPLTVEADAALAGPVDLPAAREPWLTVAGTATLTGPVRWGAPAKDLAIPADGLVLLRAGRLVADPAALATATGAVPGRLAAPGDGTLRLLPP